MVSQHYTSEENATKAKIVSVAFSFFGRATNDQLRYVLLRYPATIHIPGNTAYLAGGVAAKEYC